MKKNEAIKHMIARKKKCKHHYLNRSGREICNIGNNRKTIIKSLTSGQPFQVMIANCDDCIFNLEGDSGEVYNENGEKLPF